MEPKHLIDIVKCLERAERDPAYFHEHEARLVDYRNAEKLYPVGMARALDVVRGLPPDHWKEPATLDPPF